LTDLISREAVQQMLGAFMAQGIEQGFGDAKSLLENINLDTKQLPAIKPQIVANISGGVLQGASSDYRVDLYTLDFDLDTFDHDATGIMVDGDLSYFGQVSPKIDPDFVERVVEADTVFLHNGAQGITRMTHLVETEIDAGEDLLRRDRRLRGRQQLLARPRPGRARRTVSTTDLPQDGTVWYGHKELYEGKFRITIDVPDDKLRILDNEAVQLGLQIMAKDYPNHFADLVNETGDATTDDVFLQCCLFGELIYG
jgi:hypothetical protein